MEVLERPACSTDLRHIQNLCGIIVHCLYRYGKHYESRKQCKNGILEQWATIEQQTLVYIARTLPNRISIVLQVWGSKKSTEQGTWASISADLQLLSVHVLYLKAR